MGVILPVLGLTHLNFSYLPNGGSESMFVGPMWDVSQYTEGLVIARLHQNGMAPTAGGSMDINVYPTAPSPDDPRGFTSTTADATIQIEDGHTGPKFYSDAITSVIGAFYVVQITANQAATADDLAAQISIELVMRRKS